MLKWKATIEEHAKISAIYDRAVKTCTMNKMDFAMDIEATHSNGCPLDLDKLLNFPELDFWHDLNGIGEHLDRNTGELKDCFLLRCSR